MHRSSTFKNYGFHIYLQTRFDIWLERHPRVRWVLLAAFAAGIVFVVTDGGGQLIGLSLLGVAAVLLLTNAGAIGRAALGWWRGDDLRPSGRNSDV